MASFTSEQLSTLLFHLGIPDVSNFADVLLGDRPTRITVLAFLEALEERAKARVLGICAHMDRLIERQKEVGELAEADRLGDMQLDPQAFEKLQRQYEAFRLQLQAFVDPSKTWSGAAQAPGSICGTWST